ncbi:DNA replication protein [Chimaeribacter arupi]|uniref:DNA replication protein n=1 Tax=Chimaeribacter arupi TaxID=2060066 RepID=UPI00271213D3|nr:DNA replication protein [Chimaeribacter arupi]WKZ93588.1 DNA replication protein [Chimaeribacter arupi]
MSVVRKISDHRDYKQQDAKPSLDKGFALFHRKIMDCGFYKDSQAVHLWFHLVMKATHKPIVSTTEFGDIRLQRGQCITGRHKLASETGISPDRIQYLLRKFSGMEMISTESNRKFTVISILKYDEYQADFLPTDYQQITNANPRGTRAVAEVVPTDSQPITTYNELNTNNSISKDIECAAGSQKRDDQKQRISCEEVWQCLKEELPEARGWRVMDETRRNLIKRFWSKANKIARQMDGGQPLTMEGFRSYLQYISANCRWMLEDRPDNRTGKTWRRMKFDSFLSEKLYLEVREGDKDDR